MKRVVLLVVFCVVFGFTAACGQQSDSNPVRKQIHLDVGAAAFDVEIASTEAQRETGLMYRSTMPESQGMIFVFDQEDHLSFWMKNTKIPLSVAYISSSGEIREIYDMEPFSLRPIDAEHYAKYALELNKGAFARAGVKVGDFVKISEIPIVKQ